MLLHLALDPHIRESFYKINKLVLFYKTIKIYFENNNDNKEINEGMKLTASIPISSAHKAYCSGFPQD